MANRKEPIVKVVKVPDADLSDSGDVSEVEAAHGTSPIPPDETFWHRYSPNQEAPISGLGSLVFHFFAVIMLVFGIGFLLNLLSRGEDPDLEPVIVGDEGGGGGHVDGVGDGAGHRSRPQDVAENIEKNDQRQPTLPTPDNPDTKSNPSSALDALPDEKDLIERQKSKAPPSAALGPVLKDALTGLAGKGRGGPGSGGGQGKGVGKGTGDGVGDGSGTKRGRRVLRWVMKFNISSGSEYLRELNMCGAILGVPDDNGNVLVIRELLRKPAQGKVEDVKKLNRIFWIDNNPDSMQAMAAALGLEKVPREVIAFFPYSLEQKLLERELAYGKKYGRKTEEDIEETVFQMQFRGGKPDPIVVEQRGKK
jgi:hypothetical protein